MRCSSCGFENPVSAKFCQECGARLARVCPHCGCNLTTNASFCSKCGTTLVVGGQAEAVAPIHYTPPHLAERILAERAAFEARSEAAGERKTITALFADMAGSTMLINDLDPEEADKLIAPVIALMMEAVHHYEGYVAKSLGDGILALFGAPIAHEDHPQRALYAALRMQDAMRRHSDQVRLEQGIALHVRVGVHTGEVVVRSIRKDDLRADYDPVGQTIHIASRMETMAAPASILVSESTYKLAQGYFDFNALGAAQVKGVPAPLAVYEVRGLGPLRTRLQVAARRGLAPFVGRESELQALHRALERTTAGHGQVVGVVGEAGVGKSRLFLEFKERSQREVLVLETFSVSHGKAFPYLPLIELLRNYFKITVQDDERQCREKVTGKLLTLERSLEDLLPYLLALFGASDPTSALAEMDVQTRRSRTFEAITRLLLRESLNQPIELLFEDLQWLDSETEAFLAFFVERVVSAKVLLLVNYRPGYQPDWTHKNDYTQLGLDPLGEAEAQGLLSALLGDDQALVPLKQLILRKTEGNPFFMEEVVQTLVEESALIGERGRYRIEQTPTALHIPTTVQGVLAARIDRLRAVEKALLQTLAVIGKEFPWSLLKQVCSGQAGLPEGELRRLLSSLQAAEFIYQRPAFPEVAYTFKHALTQEVAGQSLLSEQRCLLHERTAQGIEALYPTRLNDYCNELAHHYSQSGNVPKAIEYLQCAGQQALQRSANLEAIQHLGAALELLERLPGGPERARQELAMQLALGPILMAARGPASPQVKAAYTRAMTLCEQVGEASQLIPVQLGLRVNHTLRAEHAIAHKLAERALHLAQSAQDPGLLAEAHSAVGTSAFFQGDLVTARAHLERVLDLYDPDQHREHAFVYGLDPGIFGLSVSAWILWFLGYADQASKRSQEAFALAQRMSHPSSLALTLITTANLHQFRREAQQTQACAEAAITLSAEQGFPFWLAYGTILQGWALAEQGDIEPGIAIINKGLAAYQATGAEISRSHFLTLLAAAYGHAGQTQSGLSALTEALAAINKTGERFYEAEVYRLKGELMLHSARSEPSCLREAEACFQNALSVASRQGAKALELRATLSLARLWQTQGKSQAALQRIATIYGAFREGFDSPDLREAKALVENVP
ncbi:adenylate/guanylate cyclase domain-containing protein [Paraburkholderia silviterrae]|uniref:Adenylate/guanylate cyclase domain-containing protein n=1 Tax=Paraburkholderia silviterrae TaxID=2528715 RepID=A0A4V6PJ67_9BURK|nr:adenylate/guanylate cyclase domain-containing protein [Paraburkholderia silviterrae]TDG25954.1 adenylate/guanylate cyclase domain-containing protein [Paraburkholderia silviterrae]